ncbi:hypothetical protein EV129_117123 [Rhizobium azibense]|uniref:Uncharacterized protein n=1 Tax=Rhizobium azibense TaxID=1136135 RepID=A0A4R3RNN3_9HYPH|nr:hypothetical protein EV129_117123 [Rhizobium azibense]
MKIPEQPKASNIPRPFHLLQTVHGLQGRLPVAITVWFHHRHPAALKLILAEIELTLQASGALTFSQNAKRAAQTSIVFVSRPLSSGWNSWPHSIVKPSTLGSPGLAR